MTRSPTPPPGRRAACPGEPRAERAVRGAAAREQDLPIGNYDDLRVAEINSRLPKLSDVDLSKVEAYERTRKKRKTVLQKIESLRNVKSPRGSPRQGGREGRHVVAVVSAAGCGRPQGTRIRRAR